MNNPINDNTISLTTWQQVEPIAEYWAAIYRKLITPVATMTHDIKNEERVKDFLKKHPSGVTKSDFNKLRSVSTRDRNEILKNLIHAEWGYYDDEHASIK